MRWRRSSPTYGGRPVAAPALREIPLESNPEALALADALKRGAFDIVILLTGVGTRVLLDVVQATSSRDEFVAALARTKVVPRGPKPLAVLRELKITPWITVPEPNTWRELLAALDEKARIHCAPVATHRRTGIRQAERRAPARSRSPRCERDERARLPLGAP